MAMRYRGQSFELEVRETSGESSATFHRAHRERYGYAQEESEVEIVSARLRSFGLTRQLPVNRIRSARGVVKPSEQVTAWFSGRKLRVGVYRRDELRGGVKLK